MPTWYAVYNNADGSLESIGTVVANPLPPGVTAVALASPPDLAQVQWDKVQLKFVAIPTPPADPIVNQAITFLNTDYTGANQAQMNAAFLMALKGIVKGMLIMWGKING